MMAARASSVACDGLVFCLTWMAARPAAALGTPATILVVMRDTAIYFGFLFALNVMALGLAAARLTQFIIVISTWTAILTSILLSRLMLDLRAVITDSEVMSSEYSDGVTRNYSFCSPSTSLSHTFRPLVFVLRTIRREQDALALTTQDSEHRGDSRRDGWTLRGTSDDRMLDPNSTILATADRFDRSPHATRENTSVE